MSTEAILIGGANTLLNYVSIFVLIAAVIAILALLLGAFDQKMSQKAKSIFLGILIVIIVLSLLSTGYAFVQGIVPQF